MHKFDQCFFCRLLFHFTCNIYRNPFLELVVIMKHVVSSLLMFVCLKCVPTLHKTYLSWMLKRMFRFSMLEQSYFSIARLFSPAKQQFSFLKLNHRDVMCSQPIADFNVFAMLLGVFLFKVSIWDLGVHNNYFTIIACINVVSVADVWVLKWVPTLRNNLLSWMLKRRFRFNAWIMLGVFHIAMFSQAIAVVNMFIMFLIIAKPSCWKEGLDFCSDLYFWIKKVVKLI